MASGPPISGITDSEPARLDVELVRRGLARSRAQARELLAAGAVDVAGCTVTKASMPVRAVDPITLTAPAPAWVGRAADKLVQALRTFQVPVAGLRCLDVGASTGGFTQVLLANGAAQVVALDVGHDQLADVLRTDPRVREVSRTSIRGLPATTLGDPFELVVADLSFISLTLVLADLARQLAPEGDLVCLVKPQFEVGSRHLDKHGVVRSAQHRREALERVMHAATEVGLGVLAGVPSSTRGTHGNQEYLVWLTPRPDGRLTGPQIERLIARMEPAP